MRSARLQQPSLRLVVIMPATLAPFLYQTRTLLRLGKAPCALNFARYAHFSRRPRRPEHSIPFEWDVDSSKPEPEGLPTQQESTITPSEAEIFKGIFDEISQGKVKVRKTQTSTTAQSGDEDSSQPDHNAHAIVGQARQAEFAERILRRYPKSLRQTAQVALGLYEVEPGHYQSTKSLQMDGTDQAAKLAERARIEGVRQKEAKRVTSLLESATSEDKLWKVMEQHVFSLPLTLGIAQASKAAQDGESDVAAQPKRVKKAQSKKARDDKQSIEINGPLFSQYLTTGLRLFDTAFTQHPSPYAFQILPRLKALGLPSYVLGASTPFFATLARIHWERYGDVNAALDVLQEMGNVGLYADEEVRDLLDRIADNLHACTWGAQGPFVMAMMDAPPYDGALTQRLTAMKQQVARSLIERARDLPA